MSYHWHDAKKRCLGLREGNTVLEKFLNISSELTSAAYCWDEQVGVLSYKDMRKAIIALALEVARYPEQRVGIMMPASAGAFIAYFAILLAGKIPVMINWSQGLREISACIELAQVQHILTSKQLVDNLQHVQKEDLTCLTSLVYMERIRKELSLCDKIRTGIYQYLPNRLLLRLFNNAKQDAHDIGVILFTSGTEKLPKGVPLTHANLIENQQACAEFFAPVETDVMMAFLPPFHAFGFNCCALFPMLVGLPIVFSYNPLQPKKLVELIDKAGVSFLGSTPVFFDYILKTALKQGTDLKSLRLVVVGGDVFKDSLREQSQHHYPHIVLLQGYGTTESSPVVTINTKIEGPQDEHCVGMPIGGMEVRIVEEETYRPVSQGEKGLVIIHGTSLFSGYLGDDSGKEFIQIDGKDWYITGDLGCLDSQGNLFLHGRLSRFIKIGGEMISLQAIEDLLIEGFGLSTEKEGIPLVVCGIVDDKPKLCLFTTFSTTVHETNNILKNLKASSIIKISYQHQIDVIPMLGTGKPDYRALNALAWSLSQSD